MRKRDTNIWRFTEPEKDEIQLQNIQNELYAYMDARFTFNDVYAQIQAKTCPLPKRVRDYVLSHYDSNGDFITN